jgi:pyrroloquinoline-quinone synthase
LWLQFAERLGVPAAVAEDAALWPETKALIERFRAVCRDRGTAAGLAALYAYESQVPEVSESKIDGLRRFYGFADAAGYEYFRVHIKADREHSGAERRLLAGQVNAGNREAVLHAVDEVVTSLNGLLSGVCDRHDICQTARA